MQIGTCQHYIPQAASLPNIPKNHNASPAGEKQGMSFRTAVTNEEEFDQVVVISSRSAAAAAASHGSSKLSARYRIATSPRHFQRHDSVTSYQTSSLKYGSDGGGR